jgi:hypothetical protein
MPIFNKNARVCMERFDERADGSTFDLKTFWDRLSLNNILATSMGVKDDVQSGRNDETLKDTAT